VDYVHKRPLPERLDSGHSIRVGATQDMLALNIDLASVMQAGQDGMARTARAQGRS
jgi:hypothetical protein